MSSGERGSQLPEDQPIQPNHPLPPGPGAPPRPPRLWLLPALILAWLLVGGAFAITEACWRRPAQQAFDREEARLDALGVSYVPWNVANAKWAPPSAAFVDIYRRSSLLMTDENPFDMISIYPSDDSISPVDVPSWLVRYEPSATAYRALADELETVSWPAFALVRDNRLLDRALALLLSAALYDVHHGQMDRALARLTYLRARLDTAAAQPDSATRSWAVNSLSLARYHWVSVSSRLLAAQPRGNSADPTRETLFKNFTAGASILCEPVKTLPSRQLIGKLARSRLGTYSKTGWPLETLGLRNASAFQQGVANFVEDGTILPWTRLPQGSPWLANWDFRPVSPYEALYAATEDATLVRIGRFLAADMATRIFREKHGVWPTSFAQITPASLPTGFPKRLLDIAVEPPADGGFPVDVISVSNISVPTGQPANPVSLRQGVFLYQPFRRDTPGSIILNRLGAPDDERSIMLELTDANPAAPPASSPSSQATPPSPR